MIDPTSASHERIDAEHRTNAVTAKTSDHGGLLRLSPGNEAGIPPRKDHNTGGPQNHNLLPEETTVDTKGSAQSSPPPSSNSPPCPVVVSPPQQNNDETATEQPSSISVSRFLRNIVHHPNFWFFAVCSVLNELQATFNGEFAALLVDVHLRSHYGLSARASYLSVESALMSLCNLVIFSALAQTKGVYFVFVWTVAAKLVVGAVLLLFVPPTGWVGAAYFLLCNVCTAGAMCFWRVLVASVVDEYHYLFNRGGAGTNSGVSTGEQRDTPPHRWGVSLSDDEWVQLHPGGTTMQEAPPRNGGVAEAHTTKNESSSTRSTSLERPRATSIMDRADMINRTADGRIDDHTAAPSSSDLEAEARWMIPATAPRTSRHDDVIQPDGRTADHEDQASGHGRRPRTAPVLSAAAGAAGAASVVSLFWGLHALLAKPIDSLAPVVGTWVFERAGWTGDRMRGEVTAEALDAAYYLTVGLPVCCGAIQLWALRKFTLHGERLRVVQGESCPEAIRTAEFERIPEVDEVDPVGREEEDYFQEEVLGKRGRRVVLE